MSCRIVKKVCKTEDETKRWSFDYAGFNQESGEWGFLARVWSPGMISAADLTIRPSLPTGYEYVSSGGQSGQTEPRWPKTLGGTVVDGSVTWTAQAISNDSLVTFISVSEWGADTGITADSETLVATDGVQVTTIFVSGGTAGELYDVSNVVTLDDGSVEESVLRVSVE